MENSTKVSTGKVDPKSLLRFSYVNIEKAKAAPGSTRETFGLSVIVPKTHKKIIRALEDALAAAEEASPNPRRGRRPCRSGAPTPRSMGTASG